MTIRSQTNKQVALDYYKKYGLNVIPTKGKVPVVSWIGFQRERMSEEDFQKIWRGHADLNIALITGKLANITVIDVDDENHELLEELLSIQTPTSKTGRGGYHFYFKYDQELGTSAGYIDKVDVRSDGGIIVLPPSIHPNGKKYEWIIDFEQPVAKIPVDLKRKLIINSSKLSSSGDYEQGVEVGRRNDTATKVIGKYLLELQEDDWETVAWPRLVLWNDKNNPPLSEQELRKVFNSISRREKMRRSSGTHTPALVELLDHKVTLDEVYKKVDNYLPGMLELFKLTLAVTASAVRKKDILLWFLIIGVPSSGKTDMVSLFRGGDSTYFVDTMTENAFISGERETKGKEVYDLLPALDQKCYVVKDMTAMFSLDERKTKKIIGDFVNIYDGYFSKSSPTRGHVEYKSEFSFIGCVTPATLNKHSIYMNMVGPRFLGYQLPQMDKDQTNTIMNQIFQNADRKEDQAEAQKYVLTYLKQMIGMPYDIQWVDEDIMDYLMLSANIIAICRGVVDDSREVFSTFDEQVEYFAVNDKQTEMPFRALKQLKQLAGYLAFTQGRKQVNVSDLEIIKKVTLSSMPTKRFNAINAVIAKDGVIVAKEHSEIFGTSQKTAHRVYAELVALGLMQKIKGTGTLPNEYKIREEYLDYFLQSPREFLSHKD